MSSVSDFCGTSSTLGSSLGLKKLNSSLLDFGVFSAL